jgi:hypothetical protein
MAMQQILIGYSLASGGAAEPTPNYSTLFDGNGDYLDSPNNGDSIGTANFTIEFWVRFASTAATLETISETRSSAAASDGFLLGRFHGGSHDNKLELYTNGNYSGLASGALSNNTWYYIAVVRNAGTTKMYVNGEDTGTSYADSNNYTNDDIRIGANVDTTYFMDGNIADYRLTKSALYTANFSVPTEQLTGIQYTSLLCCQDNTNPGTATVGSDLTEVGDVVAVPVAATTSGGGDQIYVDDVFSTFLYNGNDSIINGIDLASEGGLVWIKNRDTTQNNWLLSEDLGSNNPLSSNLTASTSTNVTNWFGADPLYTFNNNGFTLADQAQLTSANNYVSWTFRKAPGFFDIVSYSGCYAASSNNYNIDRGVSFDGTGDYLTLAQSNDFDLTGDYTYEAFIYYTDTTNNPTIFDFSAASGNYEGRLQIQAGTLYLYDGGWQSRGAISANTWHHIAVTQAKVYVDGIDVGASSGSVSGSNYKVVTIGARTNDGGTSYGDYFTGYISNVRIVNGTALYTSNFTVPTAPLTNVTNTKLLCCQSNTSASAAAVGESSVSRIPSGFTYWTAGYTSGWSSAGSKTSSTTVSDYVSSALPASGKHYWETTVNNPSTYRVIGVTDDGGNAAGNAGYQDNMSGFYYNGNPPLFLAKKSGGTSTASGVTHGAGTGNNWVDGDIIQWAFDADNSKMWIGRNGTWYSGDPGAGTGEAFSSMPASPYFKLAYVVDSNNTTATFEIMSAAAAGETYPKVNGNATAVNLPNNNVLSHSLGSVPGMIVVKNLTTGTNWETYHRSTGATKKLELNEPAAAGTNSGTWLDTEPTASVFTVGSNNQAAQDNYVAYIFAHDDAQFGTNSDESIIKCGSFTTDGSGAATVDLGFEPQWILTKSSANGNWGINDSMRGLAGGKSTAATPYAQGLFANLFTGEGNWDAVSPFATGFNVLSSGVFGTNETGIYMAIRRPNKPPVYGTDVFNAVSDAGSNSARTINAGNLVDLQISGSNTDNASYPWHWLDRLRGALTLNSNNLSSESGGQVGSTTFDSMNGIKVAAADGWSNEAPYGAPYIRYFFTRSPGVLDMVAWSGNSVAGREIPHSLDSEPEIIILKVRNQSDSWVVYNQSKGNQFYSKLDTDDKGWDNTTMWNSTSPTSTVFTVGDGYDINYTGNTYIGYLFASKSGVSKIGTYTGTSNTGAFSVNLGFLPRFLMVKSLTQDNRDWIVFDSKRNFTVGSTSAAGIALNNTDSDATQGETDSVRATTTGFVVVGSSATTNVNELNEEYLYLAIA